jgi:hypothetical protein
VYDLVADFAHLNIPAGASPTSITQTAGSTWTYKYENSAHNHDGSYALMTNGWNANYRGYGLSSFVSGGYPAGANVRAVINATDDPNGLSVPSPSSAKHLRSYPATGAGSIWEPLVIVWTAASNGTAVVSITATNVSANTAANTTDISLDYWNGATLAMLDSTSLTGLTAYALCATQKVAAGDQIHIWRDAYVSPHAGILAFSGTITWTPPPPPKGTVISIK